MILNDHHDKALFLNEDFSDMARLCIGFYELTYERDQKFIQNMLRKIDDGSWMIDDGNSTIHHLSSAIPQRPKAAVLITGGYHTPNLKHLLRQKNISYISITPQVTHETNIKRYEEILLSQPSFAETSPMSPARTPSLTMTPFVAGGRLAGSHAESFLRNFGEADPKKNSNKRKGSNLNLNTSSGHSSVAGAKLADRFQVESRQYTKGSGLDLDTPSNDSSVAGTRLADRDPVIPKQRFNPLSSWGSRVRMAEDVEYTKGSSLDLDTSSNDSSVARRRLADRYQVISKQRFKSKDLTLQNLQNVSLQNALLRRFRKAGQFLNGQTSQPDASILKNGDGRLNVGRVISFKKRLKTFVEQWWKRVIHPKEDDSRLVSVSKGKNRGKIQIHGENNSLFLGRAFQNLWVARPGQADLSDMNGIKPFGSKPDSRALRDGHVQQELHVGDLGGDGKRLFVGEPRAVFQALVNVLLGEIRVILEYLFRFLPIGKKVKHQVDGDSESPNARLTSQDERVNRDSIHNKPRFLSHDRKSTTPNLNGQTSGADRGADRVNLDQAATRLAETNQTAKKSRIIRITKRSSLDLDTFPDDSSVAGTRLEDRYPVLSKQRFDPLLSPSTAPFAGTVGSAARMATSGRPRIEDRGLRESKSVARLASGRSLRLGDGSSVGRTAIPSTLKHPASNPPPSAARLAADVPDRFGGFFEREGPMILEIGPGDGELLREDSRMRGDASYVGIGPATWTTARPPLDPKILWIQSTYETALPHLPDRRFDEVRLIFPRLSEGGISAQHLALLHNKLAPGGRIILITENGAYAHRLRKNWNQLGEDSRRLMKQRRIKHKHLPRYVRFPLKQSTYYRLFSKRSMNKRYLIEWVRGEVDMPVRGVETDADAVLNKKISDLRNLVRSRANLFAERIALSGTMFCAFEESVWKEAGRSLSAYETSGNMADLYITLGTLAHRIAGAHGEFIAHDFFQPEESHHVSALGNAGNLHALSQALYGVLDSLGLRGEIIRMDPVDESQRKFYERARQFSVALRSLFYDSKGKKIVGIANKLGLPELLYERVFEIINHEYLESENRDGVAISSRLIEILHRAIYSFYLNFYESQRGDLKSRIELYDLAYLVRQFGEDLSSFQRESGAIARLPRGGSWDGHLRRYALWIARGIRDDAYPDREIRLIRELNLFLRYRPALGHAGLDAMVLFGSFSHAENGGSPDVLDRAIQEGRDRVDLPQDSAHVEGQLIRMLERLEAFIQSTVDTPIDDALFGFILFSITHPSSMVRLEALRALASCPDPMRNRAQSLIQNLWTDPETGREMLYGVISYLSRLHQDDVDELYQLTNFFESQRDINAFRRAVRELADLYSQASGRDESLKANIQNKLNHLLFGENASQSAERILTAMATTGKISIVGPVFVALMGSEDSDISNPATTIFHNILAPRIDAETIGKSNAGARLGRYKASRRLRKEKGYAAVRRVAPSRSGEERNSDRLAVDFLSRVFAKLHETGGIVIGSDLFELEFENGELVISGFGTILLRTKDWTPVETNSHQGNPQAMIALSDFQVLLQNSFNQMKSIPIDPALNEIPASVEVDLTRLFETFQASSTGVFCETILYPLLEEMVAVRKHSYGKNVKFLLRGSDVLLSLAAARLAERCKGGQDYFFIDEKLVPEQFKQNSVFVTTPGGARLGRRNSYLKKPRPGDFLNVKVVRLWIFLARIKELAVTDPHFMQFKSGMEVLLGYPINNLNDFIAAIQALSTNKDFYALKPLFHATLKEAVRAARLAVRMSAQSA